MYEEYRLYKLVCIFTSCQLSPYSGVLNERGKLSIKGPRLMSEGVLYAWIYDSLPKYLKFP